MEFPIQLALSHENWFSTFLTIHQKGKNIYFNYGNPKEDPLFSDSFYSYKYIDIDDNESSMISFHGISHRIIIFENKYAVSNIWLYLQKFVDFISVPDKKQRFSINEKDCSLPEKNYLTESAQNSNLLKKNIDLDLEDPLTWNFDPTVNFDFARSSSVTFISLPFTEVNIDNIDEYFDKETKIIKTNRLFSTINIDNKGYANIFWDSLIGKIDEIFFNEYQKLRNQWVLTSENQWNNDSSIRKFVSTLEAKLDSLEIQAHILRQVMFDSLMSLYCAKYGIEFSDLLFQFAYILTKTFFIGVFELEIITDFNGNKTSFEDSAAIIFIGILKLYNMFIDKRHKMFILPLSYSIYSSIQEGIAFFTPHVKDFLNNGKISNLEFLTQHIENLFIQGRSFSESQLIIAWLITSENPRYLIKLFVGAIIADVATKDEIIEEKRLDIQHELINSEISKANLRLLIFNVDNLKVFIELQHKVRFQ